MKLNVIYKKNGNTKLVSYIDPANPNWEEELQSSGRDVGADFAWLGHNQVIKIRYDDEMPVGFKIRVLE